MYVQPQANTPTSTPHSPHQLLWQANIGSHMWKMERPDSDVDLADVVIAHSDEVLLGTVKGTKFIQNETEDHTTLEIGKLIDGLITGNVNYFWVVSSPIITHTCQSWQQQLYQILSANIAKNCYKSIHGLATHNIYHFLQHPDKLSHDLYRKKLNIIGRTVMFGINILLYHKIMYQKTELTSKAELDQLVMQLEEAATKTTLPDKPDPQVFYAYLLKIRKWKYEHDYLRSA